MELCTRVVACLLALCLGACSAALDWRQVTLGRLTVLMPCKPDRAQRSQTIGAHRVVLAMAGCEAGGGLFAISHVRAPDAAAVADLAAQWRAATLANLGVAVAPSAVALSVHSATWAERLSAHGKRADGAGVEAQLAWVVSGQDVFHIAMYGPQSAPQSLAQDTDMLFSAIQVQP